MADDERNRFSARAARYAKVGANVGGAAARIAGNRLLGRGDRSADNAAVIAAALGSLKGPLMKVGQLMATVPDLLSPEYAEELRRLQSDAPPMGWSFVKRRMSAELGRDWEQRFRHFEHQPAAAASLGQVHKAVTLDGETVACKLQYPDMQAAVEADLAQLQVLLSLHRRMGAALDTREVAQEIAERIREELDYVREARNAALYGLMLKDESRVRVPVVRTDLSTGRLLTQTWMDGEKILTFKERALEERNTLAETMFAAWWRPFTRFGVIHGDPHLGNYTVFTDDEGRAQGLNLLDYGCIRVFPPSFVAGVMDLYRGLLTHDMARVVHAYETWGFRDLSKELIEALNVWARFIYGPVMDDRVRTLADGVTPGQYGHKEASTVHAALKRLGPVTVPREFVFMDRAAVGLGAVFLHLRAEINFHRLFESAIGDFDIARVTARQDEALAAAGLA